MSSRRRNSKKNLGNSISEIQRRIRRMERKPIRTRLQNRVIKGSAIAPSTITAEEVDFGTAVVTSDNPADVIDNPKDGLLVIDPDTNSASVYSETQGDYVNVTDPTARASADGKNTIYRSTTQPTGGTYVTGDTWFDEDDNNKIYRYNGTSFVALQLGGSALANINANSITSGTIDANVITVSNIDAGNISVGTLSGITIQTSSTGNRIAMTNTDELQFFNTAGARIGTIGPTDYGPISQEGLVLTSGVPGAADTARLGLQSDGFTSYAHLTANDFLSPSVILTYANSGATQRIDINGGGSSAPDGSVNILAGQGGITIRSYTGDSAAADEISFVNEYSNSGSIGLISDRIRLYGALVLGEQSVAQGSGAPANYVGQEASSNIGAIYFVYT